MGKASLTIAISGEYNGNAIKKAQQDLQKMQATAAANAGGIAGSLVKAGSAAAEMGGKIYNAGKTMESVGKSATMGLTVPIVAAATACGAAAIDIDTALTGVRKTVDGTADDYQNLKDKAIEFSKTNAVPASQILGIEALGAQLGFTIDELDEFSRVVSGLDIATDMDAETAASELAHFANITKMSHGEVSNYASTIVDLGNHMATTESEISSMAMRVAAAGHQVGMSQADILGVSAALTSMGITAEAGGTAISTIIAQIDRDVARQNDALEVWADTAQMSVDQFSKAWKEDAVGALGAVLSGMEAATTEGSNMSLMLDELGISSLRQTDVMKRLAGNSELYGEAVSLANNAWTENIALQKEVDNRNQSMAARLDMLRNKVTAVAESVGTPLVNAMLDVVDAAEPIIDSIGDAAKAFSNLDKKDQQMIVGLVATAAAFGPVLTVAGKLTKGVGNLVTGLSKGAQALGITVNNLKNANSAAGTTAAALTGTSAGAEALGASAKGASVGANLLANGLKLIGTVAKTAAIGLAVDLIVKLVGQFQAYQEHAELVDEATNGMINAVDAARESYEAFVPSVDAASESTGNYGASVQDTLQKQADLAQKMRDTWSGVGTNAATIDYYASVIQDLGFKGKLTADEQVRLKDAVSGFNELTGEAIGITNAQTGELNTQKEAVVELTNAYKEQAREQAARELYQDTIKQQIQNELELKRVTEELTTAEQGFGLWFGDWYLISDEASRHYHELQQDAEDLTAALDANRQTAQLLTDIIGQGAGSFDTFEAALESCKVSMEDFGDISTNELNDLKSKFDGSLTSIVNACTEKGLKIPQALADGIMNNSGLPTEQQQVMLDAMVLQMAGGDVEAAAKALGHDIDDGLRQGIEGGAELPRAAIGLLSDEVIAKAKDKFESHSPSQVMYRLGEDIDVGLKEGINGSSNEPVSAMGQVSDLIHNAIAGLPLFSQQVGSDAGANLSGGLSSQRGNVNSSATNLYETAKSGLEPTKSAYGSIGTDAANEFSGAIGRSSAQSEGAALAQSGNRGLSSVSTYGAGESFARGFGSGMNGVDLFSVAWSIGMSALRGIKAALGIHSPSKEAYGVGENYILGAIYGMQSQERALAQESATLSGLMSLNPQDTQHKYINRYEPTRRDSSVNFNVTINVNATDPTQGVAVGQSIADTIFSEYQKRERGLAYALA